MTARSTGTEPNQPDALTTAERRLHLGGIGSSFVAIDSQGRFYPTAASGANALSSDDDSGALSAVRVESCGSTYVGRLQCGLDAVSMQMPPLDRRHLAYREDFPTAHFALRNPGCPIEVVYSVFSPIIPFDHDCSTLPVMLYCVRTVNPTPHPVDVSVLLSWTPAVWTPDLSPRSSPSEIPIEEKFRPRKEDTVAEKEETPPNAVVFGSLSEDPEEDEVGGILSVYPDTGLRLSRCAWNPEDASAAVFWEGFENQGALPAQFMLSDNPTHGALCAEFTLEPGMDYRLDFAVVWSEAQSDPQRAVRRRFMSQFKGPFPLARQSLRYVEYYYRSIEEWQKRLAHSSLPQKMGRALVHTLNVLTADAIANDQEGWALPTEIPYSPEERTRLRLYTSIANAVLFPRFEEAEWDLFATLIPDDSPPRHPDLAELLALTPVKDREVSIVLACQIITLYRNYRLSGGQVRVRRRFPALARHFLSTTPFEGATAWETGIRIVAVRACGELANKETQTDPADFRTLFDRALRQFEDQFWDPVAECYRQRAVATPGAMPETYSGQLAAQFFADFFKWDHMLQEERVAKSLTSYSGDPTPHIREERCPTDLGAAGHVIADIERTALQFAHGMEEAGTHNMALLVQRAIDRHTPPAPQWLALWHLLFTVEGVFLDVAAGRLHIAPQLPADMMSVSAPVFTAVCLGSLKYSLVREPSYRLQVQVELDSPVMLNDVKLFAPGPPPDARVRCTVNDDPAPCEIEVVPQSTGAHYRVRFRQPIFLNGAIYISIG